MEVICINDVFVPQVLAFYAKFNVQTPIRDKVYTVTSFRKNSVDGKTGVLLAELQNPDVPIVHPVLGEQWVQPSFDVKRFTTLLGEPVKQEELVLEKS